MSSSPATFRSPHCHRREIEVSSRFVMSPSKRTDGEKGCDQRLMYLCATDGRSPAVTALTAAATDKLLAIPLRRRRTSRLYLRIKRKRRNYFIAAPQDLSNRTSGERAARDGGDGDGGGEGSRTLNVTAGSTDRLEYNTVDLIICCIKLASVTCSCIAASLDSGHRQLYSATVQCTTYSDVFQFGEKGNKILSQQFCRDSAHLCPKM